MALSHFSGFQHKELVTGTLVLPAVIWLFFYWAIANLHQLAPALPAEITFLPIFIPAGFADHSGSPPLYTESCAAAVLKK